MPIPAQCNFHEISRVLNCQENFEFHFIITILLETGGSVTYLCAVIKWMYYSVENRDENWSEIYYYYLLFRHNSIETASRKWSISHVALGIHSFSLILISFNTIPYVSLGIHSFSLILISFNTSYFCGVTCILRSTTACFMTPKHRSSPFWPEK